MPNPNWAIYARSAADKGDPGLQLQICRQFIFGKRGIIEKEFTDAGEVQDSPDRPGIAALIKNAKNGAFKYLAILKPDRLSQDQEELTDILGTLHEAGIVVWNVSKKSKMKIARPVVETDEDEQLDIEDISEEDEE